MADIIDKLLGFSLEQLGRWHSRRRRRGRYARKARPVFSKEKLVEYLRQKGFKTRDQLRAGRGEGNPTDDDYRKAYGSWGDAVKEIWPKETLTKEYVAKALIEFKLWSKSAYETARKRRPDVLPSMRFIRREFGSWSVLKEIARAMSLRETLAAYMELKLRLGRRPSMDDCRMAGIIVEKAMKAYGGKRGLDRFVEALEEML